MLATPVSASHRGLGGERRLRPVRALGVLLGLFLALAAASGPAGALPPLADAFPGNDPTISSSPTGFVEIGGSVYFLASDPPHGRELWKSDGTAPGTSRVADLQPGEAGSVTVNLQGRIVEFQGAVFYAGDNGLWRTDGTAAGTQLLEWERGYNNGVHAIVALPTKLLLGTYSGLYASDGTAAGTTRVADLGVELIYPFGAQAILRGTPALGLIGVWVTDGTVAGTQQLLPPSTVNSPNNFGRLGSVVLFRALSPLGVELWKTDGTSGGTVIVKDIRSGAASSSPTAPVEMGAAAYFSAIVSPAVGRELWKTDGSEAGTVLVKDINPTTNASSSPGNLFALGSTLFFAASDGASGVELWKSDGTDAGTMRVKDINPGAGSSSPRGLTSYGGALYFLADDGSSGSELWRSDGTEGGTAKVTDIGPGALGGTAATSAVFGLASGLWLAGDNGAVGSELWRSDGTPSGTALFADLAGGAGNGRGVAWRSMVEFDGRHYYVARDATHGAELWASDGTPTGTAMLKDIWPGAASSAPSHLIRVGGRVFFFANDGTSGLEFWATDGTPEGTARVIDLVPGAGGLTLPAVGAGPYYRGPAAVDGGGQVIFLADAGAGFQVWRSDGDAAGTFQVTALGAGAAIEASSNALAALGGSTFFVVFDGGAADEAGIWKTDGTPAGTTRVATCDDGVGSWCYVEGPMARLGQKLYFDSFTSEIELWATDGTLAGTGPVAPAWDTEYRTGLATRLLFVNEDASHGRELWASDGTLAGTTMVADLQTGPESSDLLGSTARLGSFLYFQASDPAGGSELWRSDGTAAGTSRVVDLMPGPAASHPRCLSAIGSEVYFAADGAGGAGFELWRTDGTAAGTALVADLEAGPEPSSPCEIVAFGGKVLFSSWDATTGRELRAIAVASAALFHSGLELGSADDWSELFSSAP